MYRSLGFWQGLCLNLFLLGCAAAPQITAPSQNFPQKPQPSASLTLDTSPTTSPTVAPTAAPTVIPTPAPTTAPSGGPQLPLQPSPLPSGEPTPQPRSQHGDLPLPLKFL